MIIYLIFFSTIFASIEINNDKNEFNLIDEIQKDAEYGSWDVRSKNGLLDVILIDYESFIYYCGFKTLLRCWNGSVVGPNLYVQPGDRLRITFINRLTEDTNLHFHGFLVPPVEHGDSVFIRIKSNQTYVYDITIPLDHPVGLSWYHSHVHCHAGDQVQHGMSGMIIVGDILKSFPTLSGIKHVTVQLKDIQLVKSKEGYFYPKKEGILTSGVTHRSANGLQFPSYLMKQNETQFWQIGAFGPNIFYNLSFGGETFYEVVRDHGILNQLVPHKFYVLGPGSRVGLIVKTPPKVIDHFNFTTLHMNMGPEGDQYPKTDLVRLVVPRNQVIAPVMLPTTGFPVLKDLSNAKIDKERYIVFSEHFEIGEFYVNGKVYDENRIDFLVKLGDTEKWTIHCDSPANHWFHVHQVHFQVVDLNNTVVPFVGYQDNCMLPYNGNTTIIIPFTNPLIVGKFVLHCHIMYHEDRGMMANVLVIE